MRNDIFGRTKIRKKVISMENHMKIFCKQHQFFEVPCPKCGKKHKFKSTEVFAKDVFYFDCGGEEIRFPSKDFSNQVKSELKRLGIKP